jgi:two-component system, cell cycle sensor histidine kinase and response regulator CckA
MNDPLRPTSLPNLRLPLWTWVVPFILFHLGTRLSLTTFFSPGVAIIYLPTALGMVLIHWWGPRVLLPLYINALICVPYWDLPAAYAPLFALPETLTVFLSWLLFSKWRKGDCAMTTRRSTLEMFAYGLLLPELIGCAYLHGQLYAFGELAAEEFWRTTGTGALSDLLAFFALTTPLLVFLTGWLRARGLAPQAVSDFRPPQPLQGGSRLLATFAIGGLLLLVSILFPVERFWFLYAAPVLGAAIFGGFRAAVLSLSWLFFLTLFLPSMMGENLGRNWAAEGRQLEVFWDLFILGFAALITGRTISDFRRESMLHEQTTRTLQMQERLLASLVENSPAVIFLKDAKGVYQLVNKAFERVVGRPRTEVIGKTDFDLFPEQVATRIAGNDREALAGSAPLQYEEVVPSPVELRRYFSVKFPLHDSSGSAFAVCGIATDVTELSAARDRLQKSEEFLRIAMTSARMGVWSRDLNTGHIEWSDSIAPLMGGSTARFDGSFESFLTFVHEPDRDMVSRAINDALAGNHSDYFIEYRTKWPDGSLHWMESRGHVFRDENGKAVRSIGAVADISLRKRIEEDLTQSQRRLSAIIETAPSLAIQMYDRDGRVLQWNKASETMFGFSAEEALGKTLDKTIHTHEEAAAFVKMLATIEATGKAIGPAEYNFRRRDGSIGQCLSTTFMLEGSNAFVCMDIDITERKQLEANFLQSQKVESIGRLAGGVAHDFNNLLTSILGYADLLRSQVKAGSDQDRFLKRISEAAQRGGSLTQQLLGYARRQVAQPAVIDLNERITKASELLKRLIGEDVELVFLPAPDLGHIKADPVQIEQVLMNLAVNARDAMPKGGKLTIETGNATLDENYARTRNEVIPGDYVMLAVSDSGTGIAPEVLPKIFDPFFTTKPVGQGTGLGLATCFGIIKQCNGHIAVYSEIGRGTTFKVYLPRTREDGVLHPADSTLAPATQGSETILLVEDDEVIREMVGTALTGMGFSVIQASNGLEALERVHVIPGKIDLLITDVVMPKMGGKDLAVKLRELRPDIKVLYTSGYTENAIVHHGVLDDGINFLQKPYTPAVLGRKIREVMDSKP